MDHTSTWKRIKLITAQGDAKTTFSQIAKTMFKPINSKISLQTISPTKIILLVTVIWSLNIMIGVHTQLASSSIKTWNLIKRHNGIIMIHKRTDEIKFNIIATTALLSRKISRKNSKFQWSKVQFYNINKKKFDFIKHNTTNLNNATVNVNMTYREPFTNHLTPRKSSHHLQIEIHQEI